jgi:hypothetical protein
MQQSFQTIEVLQEHAIAANDIEKLRNAGFHTVESVSSCVVAAYYEWHIILVVWLWGISQCTEKNDVYSRLEAPT